MSNSTDAVSPTHYISIGASAGGLEALQDLFANTPSDTGGPILLSSISRPIIKVWYRSY
ncbi:MAG: chemotaxis protein CheB [Pseudomonadota bacterium]|nr:chemotaxis protein CheB [Pseudomonadota bacterium]MEE3209476.1 chemotaxis protein CheB [Pseudomonadota bacterium]